MGEVEEGEFFGGAAAAEAGGEAAAGEEVGDGDLFGDVEGVVEVGADDGGAEVDALGLAGEVEGEEEGRGEVALVNVGVVLGEEEVVDGELVGLADEVGNFGEDFGAGRSGGPSRWSVMERSMGVLVVCREFLRAKRTPRLRGCCRGLGRLVGWLAVLCSGSAACSDVRAFEPLAPLLPLWEGPRFHIRHGWSDEACRRPFLEQLV